MDHVVEEAGDFDAEVGVSPVIEEEGGEGEGGDVDLQLGHFLDVEGEVVEAGVHGEEVAAEGALGGLFGHADGEGVEAGGAVAVEDGLVLVAVAAAEVDEALGDVVVVDVDDHAGSKPGGV